MRSSDRPPLGSFAAPGGAPKKTVELDYLEEVKVSTRFPEVNLRKDHYRCRRRVGASPPTARLASAPLAEGGSSPGRPRRARSLARDSPSSRSEP